MLYGMLIPALPQQVTKASNDAGGGCHMAVGSPFHKPILEI